MNTSLAQVRHLVLAQVELLEGLDGAHGPPHHGAVAEAVLREDDLVHLFHVPVDND